MTAAHPPVAKDVVIGDAVCDVRYFWSGGRPATRQDPEDPHEFYIEEVFVNGRWCEAEGTFADAALQRATENLLERLIDDREAARCDAAYERARDEAAQ